MKALFTTLLLGGLVASACRAQIYSADDFTPDSTNFANVYVKKIHSDERSSVFVIWIKKEVKLHRHDAHTEVVTILKGRGIMTLGKDVKRVKKGDIILIRAGTPHAVITKSRKTLMVMSVQAPIFLGDDRIWIE